MLKCIPLSPQSNMWFEHLCGLHSHRSNSCFGFEITLCLQIDAIVGKYEKRTKLKCYKTEFRK